MRTFVPPNISELSVRVSIHVQYPHDLVTSQSSTPPLYVKVSQLLIYGRNNLWPLELATELKSNKLLHWVVKHPGV